jgi:type IV pilus assembly protein PilY1
MATHLTSTLRRGAKLALVAALIAALLAPGAAEAGQRSFSSGSLIIPASIEYQSDPGVLGTYALVYVALHINAERAKAGKKKITFYWAVQPTKLSQYRCDTSGAGRETLPSYGGPNDNDGCDFAVQKDQGPPVSRVNEDNTLSSSFPIENVAYVTTFGPVRVRDAAKAALTTTANSSLSGDTHLVDSATKVVKYLGGVWLVDAVDRQDFLDLLANDSRLARFHKKGPGEPNFVNIHSANAAFRAPVVSTVADKPKRIAAIGANEYPFVVNVLENSGLCQSDTIPVTATATTPGCVGTYTNGTFDSGLVLDYYADPADLLDGKGSCSKGRLNCAVNGEKYGAFWATDSTDAGMLTAARLANLSSFLDTKGNAAYVQYDAIWRVENTAFANQTTSTADDFQTTRGVAEFNPDVKSAEDCNDAKLPAGSRFLSTGGECLVLAGANQPWAQTGNFVFDGGQGSFKAFELAGGALNTGVTTVAKVKDGPIVSSGYYKDNDTEKGLILYLSGHKFDNGRLWGERLLLNTLFSNLVENFPELARSEPVGYKNPRVSPNTTRVYQGSYVQRPLPGSNDVLTYNPAAADKWRFPFTEGHLYEYDLGKISATGASFSGTTRKWDAGTVGSSSPDSMLPLPGARRIYTYVGGSANLSWKRIEFKHTEVGSSCTDADENKKCDLGELLALGNSAGVTTSGLADKGTDDTQQKRLGLFVSQARGFCSAHSPPFTGTAIPEPTTCDHPGQESKAKLGGIDHSTPAAVGPSKYITDKTYRERPVVLYAGGRDGMLHAFYVSPGGSDAAATAWSADGESVPNGVTGGQELWAIVPPGQVPRLATNDAMVDGTINVVDVFGNFPYDRNNDGVIDWTPNTDEKTDERPNGIRRWRTILVASSAAPPSATYGFRGGSELFALDVTNPLHPVLLWYLDGPVSADGRFDVDKNGVFAGKTDVLDKADPSTYALRWEDKAGVDYDTTDTTVIDGMKTGRYDYRNLGLTYSTAVAKVWDGGAYKYILFASTNAVNWGKPVPDPKTGVTPPYTPTGYRGAEIFAIDLVTGRKQWQWEHLYDEDAGVGVDNSVPPRMALGDIDANGSTERIYLGDMEGHLWELYSRDGRNVNYKLGTDKAYHSFPLFGTPAMTGDDKTPTATDETKALYRIAGSSPARLSQQPLTTPIGQGRFTEVPTANASFLLGRLALVVGTMGVDWSIASYEKGHLFVLPIFPDTGTRLDEPIDVSDARKPMLYGVLKEKAAWQIDLDVGERVYGMPRVVNNRIIFNTAFGSFAGDLTENYNEPGNYRVMAATADNTSATKNDAKSFGGVLTIGNSVVVSTDTTIKTQDASKLGAGGVNTKTFNRSTPAVMKSWESWESWESPESQQ